MQQNWTAPIGGLISTAPVALTNTTTPTDISPGAAAGPAFSGNQLVPGSQIRLTASGVLTSPASAQATLVLGFYYGGVAGTLPLAATAATTPTASSANFPWMIEYWGTVRTTGASGTIMGNGIFRIGSSLTAMTSSFIPTTAMATVTIDTTIAKVITVGATWGSAQATSSITCHNFIAESVA